MPAPSATPKPAWWAAVGETAQEFEATPLERLAGMLPEGLRGTLYRNGPGRLERGGRRNGHWFDGDGTIAAIRFTADGAIATQKFVQTQGYQDETQAGQLLYGNYGTRATGAWWQRWRRSVKHVANTSVLALPDRLLALWEGGEPPYALTLDTLATIGLDPHITDRAYSAHPKRDPQTGEVLNFGVSVGRATELQLYRQRTDGTVIQQRSYTLKALGVPGLPLIHDFMVAGAYLVIFVPPVTVNLWAVLTGQKTYSEAMQWQPARGTQILIFDRQTLEPIAQNTAEAWFQWHFANGFVDAHGQIVIDFVGYRDLQTNEFLRQVSQGNITIEAPSRLDRVILDPRSAHCRSHETRLDHWCEFPSVAPPYLGQPYDQLFLTTRRPEGQPFGDLFSAIGSYNPQTGQWQVLDCGDRCYPSEAIYAPDQLDPVRGWLIFTVFNAMQHRSEVWIVDPQAWEIVGQFGLPQIVPIGFHGTWQAA